MTSCYAQSIKKDVLYVKAYDRVIVQHLESTYPMCFTYMEVGAEDVDRSKFKVARFTYRYLRNMEDSLANWKSRQEACNYVGEEVILKAEKLIRKQVRGLRAIIEQGKLHPAVPYMTERFKEVVKHFHDDFLFHDMKWLGEKNPATFIWCARTCGTNLYTGSDEVTLSWLDAQLKSNWGDAQEWYLWNDGKFTQIELKLVLETAKQYLPK